VLSTAPVFDEEYDGDMARRKNSVDIEGVIRVAEFRSALRQFLRESERTTRSAGLTPQRYLLLLMIKGAPDGSQQASIGELSDRLQLAQSTVTELVNRAEDSGLVSRRQSDADGRVSIVRLTRKGETRLARAIEESDAERRRLRQTVLRLGESGGKGRARKG
jgi:DNA-binding MarR family transcriptional regulator